MFRSVFLIAVVFAATEASTRRTRPCHLTKHPSIQFFCPSKNDTKALTECGDEVDDGSYVVPKCRDNYYTEDLLPHMRCKSKTWDYVARCKLECGTVTDSNQLRGSNGERKAQLGEMPWHAGIYQNYEKYGIPFGNIHLCGGSIISSNVVIAPAFCFWYHHRLLRVSQYVVAVGKLYEYWYDERDLHAQKFAVQEVKVPREYMGQENAYENDIALVFLSKNIRFNEFVRPVCLDLTENFEITQLDGRSGKITTWGRTRTNPPNENPGPRRKELALLTIDLPYVNRERCIEESQENMLELIVPNSSDKFCAYYNDTSTALCEDDSGNGLCFPETVGGAERYFLRGTFHAGPRDLTQCSTFNVFTQINKHACFIKQNVDFY